MRTCPRPTPSSWPCPTVRRPSSSRRSSPTAPPRSISGPTSACETPRTTRAGTASSIPIRSCSRRPSTGCRSSTEPALEALRDEPIRIVGAPGCYPTATLLALAPLARQPGSSATSSSTRRAVCRGRSQPKANHQLGEVNESVRASCAGGHRHVAEIEQELAAIATGAGHSQDWRFCPLNFLLTAGTSTNSRETSMHKRAQLSLPTQQIQVIAALGRCYRSSPPIQTLRTMLKSFGIYCDGEVEAALQRDYVCANPAFRSARLG